MNDDEIIKKWLADNGYEQDMAYSIVKEWLAKNRNAKPLFEKSLISLAAKVRADERERMLSDEKIWNVIIGIEYPRAREVMVDGGWITHYHVLGGWRTKEEAIQAVRKIMWGEQK